MARVRTHVAVFTVIGWLVTACASSSPASPAGGASPTGSTAGPSAAASASAAPSSSPTVAAERIADLALLVERLRAAHPNPFLDEGEAAFMARVERIEERAATLTDTGFLVAVMDLMGHRDRDGHSGAWAVAQPSALLSAWPVWLWDFPDGLRVVAARAPYEDLVGARVTKVGHATVDAAKAAVEPLVPRDNLSSLRANLPTYLVLPAVLEELGVLATGDPGLTLELADGSTREVTPDALPIETYRDWIFARYAGPYPTSLPPDPDGPPHLRHRGLAFWSEVLADPAVVYVGYNGVARANSEGRSISDLATSLRTAANEDPDRPIVIDLRNNPGGDNTTFGPLRNAVESIAADHPGQVRLIAGRSTFSAAGNFVTDLLTGDARAGLRLAGEAPGGGLNIYGDVKVVTLPASGIVVLISARYHERAPGDDRLEIAPDAPVELTWQDYVAGRDPVLEAAARP
jgi:hypothetical protein